MREREILAKMSRMTYAYKKQEVGKCGDDVGGVVLWLMSNITVKNYFTIFLQTINVANFLLVFI